MNLAITALVGDTIPMVSFEMLRPDRRVDNFHNDTVFEVMQSQEENFSKEGKRILLHQKNEEETPN